MSRLLLVNFGTFRETHRFKQRMIADGFLTTDAMEDPVPGALVRQGGVQKRTSEGADVRSFYGLRPDVWRSQVSPGRSFSTAFKAWMEKVLAGGVNCVYLTGHHAVDDKGNAAMYWDDKSNEIVYMFLGRSGELVFGTLDQAKKKAADQVSLATANLRKACVLVVGFGCNVAATNQSIRYQSYFMNGSSKPIVLGWKTTMAIPSGGGASVNARFFDYLAEHAKKNSSVPQSERLTWFYDNQPMELIRAWGHSVLAFRGSGASKLWDGARARHHDGTYYRFEEKAGAAEPVKE